MKFRIFFQRLTLVSCTIFFGLFLVMAAPADAFCVNNATGNALDVFAGQCSDCLKETLMPGATACCAAEDERCQGKYLTFKDTVDDDAWAWSDCTAQIPANGSAVLYPRDSEAEDNESASTGCRVTNSVGELVEDAIVSPSRTCPEKEHEPLAC